MDTFSPLFDKKFLFLFTLPPAFVFTRTSGENNEKYPIITTHKALLTVQNKFQRSGSI